MNRISKKLLILFFIVILVVAGAFSIWFFFFRTNDLILIKKVINKAVELSVKRQGDNAVFNAVAHNNVPKYFADKTKFNFGHGGFSGDLSTSEIIANLGRLKAVVNEIVPKIGTIQVTINNNNNSAQAYFPAVVSGAAKSGGKFREARDVDCTLVKTKQGWKITSLQIRPVLQR
jgi:hypothetical protein